MITLNTKNKKPQQNSFHISFKTNNEETNMYHQVLRRATLTSTPVSVIIKEYVNEGVKNDRFLQLFEK